MSDGKLPAAPPPPAAAIAAAAAALADDPAPPPIIDTPSAGIPLAPASYGSSAGIPVGFSSGSSAAIPISFSSPSSAAIPMPMPMTPSSATRVPAGQRRVAVWVPEAAERTLGEVLSELLTAPPAEPFAPDAVAAADRFARRLMSDPMARAHPELMTLGFFMRKSELTRMKAERAAASRPDLLEVPIGLVFHVPPANVDTIFMYSWLQSLLAGNLNLVRISARSSPLVEHLCRLLCEVLADDDLAGVRARTAMIQYGHDDLITAAISSYSALRVIWGGDATVAAIRKSPLQPHARDLTFADRFSMMALGAAAVLDSNRSELARLVEQLYNDLYWFDQAGCSSPRLCLWIGTPADIAAASELLWPELAQLADDRGYHPDLAMRLVKEVFCHRAVLDGPVTARREYGPALTVLELSSLDGLGREHPGAGLLFQTSIEMPDDTSIADGVATIDLIGIGLDDDSPVADGVPISEDDAPPPFSIADALERALMHWITRKDQTLTYFGIPRTDLADLARRLAGRGLDRIVPVGSALQMSRFWDGYDLASEMVRRVHLP